MEPCCVEHLIAYGSRVHVVSWDRKNGAVCSEPQCEVNHKRHTDCPCFTKKEA